MSKKVFIVHGWDGYPEQGWFPWLKKELEQRGFEVFVPELPQSDEPRIKPWLAKLKEVVGVPDEQTYFVGHSMGCQVIARYLETLPSSIKIGGAVFVAGFFTRLIGLEDDPIVHSVADEWLTTSVDLAKVKQHMKTSTAIFSDDDPWVSLDNQDDFQNILGSQVIIKHGAGHFSGPRDNCVELPIALQSLLDISEKS